MTMKDRLMKSEDPYLKWLRDDRGVSKTTVFHYHSYYRHFKNLKSFDQKTIQSFIQKYKNNTVVRAFVKSFIDFGSTQNYQIIFEMPPIKSGSKKKRIIKTYSKDQFQIMRDSCYNEKKSYGIMFDLLYYGALRRAEVSTIKINSFNWAGFFKDPESSCNLIIDGKGRKQRPVLIPNNVVSNLLEIFFVNDLINNHMEKEDILIALQNNEGKLFNNLYEWRVWKIINRISLKALDIAMRPHEIRHARATELEKIGASIRDIQHYLGHATPQITEVYLHTTQKTSLKNIRSIVDEN